MTPEELLEQLGSRYNCIPPDNASKEDLDYFHKGKKIIREKYQSLEKNHSI